MTPGSSARSNASARSWRTPRSRLRASATLLMPVAARRALNDLPDELWTKLNIEFYSDPGDGVFKALLE